MAEKQSKSPWVWISLFMMLGLFAAFITFLDQKIVRNGESVQPSDSRSENKTKPRFDFYSVLPDRVLDIPISEEERAAIENPTINKFAGKQVLLQVGSFQSANEADSLKAQLAFLGLEARIEPAIVNDDTWHRVILGPYTENSKFSRTKNLLIENKIKYMQRSVEP
ncbi:MAG: SPOR domain-containing protein [Proteobacteria bacterium]|nr:SPOR domain-containing protein [Pseudomonadota bacterium]